MTLAELKIYHDITFNIALDDLSELQCCDAQNPRHRPLLPLNEIKIFAVGNEIKARYQEEEYEISLCEGCYECIIATLLRRNMSQKDWANQTCSKMGCDKPAVAKVWGDLIYYPCAEHKSEIEELTKNE